MLIAIPNAKGLDGLKTNLVITDKKAQELGLRDKDTNEMIDNQYQQILIDNFINENPKNDIIDLSNIV